MALDSKYIKIPVGQKIVVEANFSTTSTPCKEFKFTIGKQSSVITREELFGLLFLFANKKEQEDLISVTYTKVKAITRLLSFKLSRSMKKGQIVKAAYTYFMPEAIVDKLLISDPERYRPADLIINKLEKSYPHLK